jgi:hypothetical protein
VNPRLLTCKQCGGALTFGAPFCAYCRAPLVWGQTIDLEPGDILSLTNNLGPVSLQADKYRWKVVSTQVRNACVSLRGCALDPFGEIGVFVRWNTEGTFNTGYCVRIYPALRSLCCERWLMGEKDKVTMPVLEWTYAPSIAPPGSQNEIEVRFADEVFQFLVNGVRVGAALDATFGFGGVAWYAGSNDAPAQLALDSLTVKRVA